MDRLEFAQLERLWHALGRVGTTQEDEDVVICEPFCSFTAGTPVLHIWVWLEAQNGDFPVARQLYETPVSGPSSA